MGIAKLTDEWHVISVCLRWKWPDLTREDLNGEELSVEGLLDMLECRIGEPRESLASTLDAYRAALELPR